jgi:hypothetical protein
MTEFFEGIKPSMALELDLAPGQRGEAAPTPQNLYELQRAGSAWHVRRDGKLVAMGGHTPLWTGRTVVWGYLGENAGPSLPAMTRKVRAQLEVLALEFPRIEAYASRNYGAASRWLVMLGFRREGLMRKFADGRDYILFART